MTEEYVYCRDIPLGLDPGERAEIEAHVREHVSTVVSLADDPERFRNYVEITEQVLPDGTLRLTGRISLPAASFYMGNAPDLIPNRQYDFHSIDGASIT